eukprot:sb/3463345/
MDSVQSLWRVLNGNTAIREEKSILADIKNNRSRIISGFLFFKPPSAASKTELENNATIKGTKLEFVKKASVLLNLDEMQCLAVFQLFLATEYKDTAASFNNALHNVLSQQEMLLQLLRFYFSERLSVINCLRYLLSHQNNEEHPLYDAIASEIKEMDGEKYDLRISLYNQIKTLLKPEYFNITLEDENMLSAIVSVKQIFSHQQKREVSALLRTLLVYNHHRPHTAESYHQQCSMLFSKVLHSGCTLMSGLAIMLTYDGLDMERVFENFEKEREKLEEHYLYKDNIVYEKVNNLFSNLTPSSKTAPLLIVWAVLRYALSNSTKDQAHARFLGQQGLKGGGVAPLLSFLQCPELHSCSVTLQLSRVTVYKVLATTLTIFHEDTLGDATTLAQVISEVLKEELLSLEFWDACAEKGVGVALSSAASSFPHNYKPLTALCYSLARTADSCDRLVQFASSLTLFTSEISKTVFNSVVRETDVDWLYTNREPFSLTPGGEFSAKPNTQCNLLGTTGNTAIVQWLYDYSLFSYLDNELSYLARWSVVKCPRSNYGSTFLLEADSCCRYVTRRLQTNETLPRDIGGIF